jgi:predicted ATPase
LYAEYSVSTLYQYRRDVAATSVHAEALMAPDEAQGVVLRFEQGRMLGGWALAVQGDAAEGIVQIQPGIVVHQRIGPRVGLPYHLSLLAGACGQAGQPEAGLTVLAEALMLAAETDERWWEAELYRLKGELLLQLPILDAHQAEACFQQALDVARSQQAKALELRAAMSLSRLWQRQGKWDAARTLLAPIYGWFTEGFDTPDLQEAKALLTERS